MKLENQEDWPCLICGKTLYRIFADEGQPSEGVYCSTRGNYGSRKFDSLNGEAIGFNICDECFVEKGNEGRLMITQADLPVRCGMGIAGSYPLDRPWVAWHEGLEPSDERMNVDFDEVIEGTYSKKIYWNDGSGGDRHSSGWPEMLVAGELHQNPSELAEFREMYADQPEHLARLNKMIADFEKLLEERAAEMERRHGPLPSKAASDEADPSL